MAKISIDLKTGALEKSQTVIGIDLGTTNSLIASIDDNGNPFCVSVDGDSIVPSALYFDNEAISVGKEAIAQMVEHPENAIYSVKRLLGKSYNDLESSLDHFNYRLIDNEDEMIKVELNGKYYSPTELSSFVLKKLKETAEQRLNSEVHKVVITVPAYFNDSQRQATRDAGKLAGLDVLRIINEPTAASLAYGLGQSKSDSNRIAVYDLGGGTFDISILHIQNGIYEVLSTNGDTFLGGDDIDQAIVQSWVKQHGLTSLSDRDKQVLRLSAERAKKQLSNQAEFKGKIEINSKQLEVSLTATSLKALCQPLIEKTINACKMALKDAELSTADIDEVVLVGGSTKSPFIKDAVSSFFNSSKLNDSINPDEIVALGAALEADILAGNRRDMLLLDVTPLSLGIETLGGLMDVVVPRNNKIPTTYKKEYSTSVDGQVNLKINVFQGEREMVKDNRRLGAFILSGIPAMPAGFPKIEVTFMLNADGILNVVAQEKRSGVKQEVEMQPQYGISEKEIEKMLKESIDNAAQDLQERSLAEAKAEANQLVYSTDNFLKKNPTLASDKQQDEIARFKTKIDKAIEDEDKDAILALVEELNEYTKPLAEMVINKEISNSLRGKKIE